MQPNDPVMHAALVDGVTLCANRATALALANRYNPSNLNAFGARVGYRGPQWAVGFAVDLLDAGYTVLA